MIATPLTLQEGAETVQLARLTLDSFVLTGAFAVRGWGSTALSEKRGVFVTLNSVIEGREGLRGCIGFPYPVKPLGQAVQEAAAAASSEDPRFPRIKGDELETVVVETSVLTVPRTLNVIDRSALPGEVRIGVDGLIVKNGPASGLLLPQVATEFGMSAPEFLRQACYKAGLPPDAWLDHGTDVQVFQAEIFGEERPRGEVIRLTT